MAQTLKTHYEKVVVPNFVESKKYSNIMEIPKLLYVTINMGVGEALADKNVIEKAMSDLEKISGQKPVACKAKKSIAGFKVREGVPIGCKVVLRRKRMYDFVERLITVALPRVRDFRGLNPRSFDGRGNFTLGLREQIVFPEIDYDKIDALRGMDITVVTSAKSNTDALQFLIEMGFPFKE